MSWDALAQWVVSDARAGTACVVASAVRRGGRWVRREGAHGRVDGGAQAKVVSTSTRFDLASVTKPVTALLAARAVRRGLLTWGTPLASLVAEAVGTPSAEVPIELLLAHRAGLAGHRQLYAPLLDGRPLDRAAALREAAEARRPGCEGFPGPDGFLPEYSDLGYLLAGEALARAAGSPLSAAMAEEVLAPLGAGAGIGAARGLRPDEVAATEDAPWRGGVVRAEVHDENAWAYGGLDVCGHAGLFGDGPSLLTLGQGITEALLGERPAWLAPHELRPLVRPRAFGTLLCGFDAKSAVGSSAGGLFGAASFGHLGFTGTSLWIDPERPLVAVLLTNRVHPTRANDAIRRVRPFVHDEIARWADA